MINRKVLYGYQIQNGALEIVPEEQRTVSMVFTLYNAGGFLSGHLGRLEPAEYSVLPGSAALEQA